MPPSASVSSTSENSSFSLYIPPLFLIFAPPSLLLERACGRGSFFSSFFCHFLPLRLPPSSFFLILFSSLGSEANSGVGRRQGKEVRRERGERDLFTVSLLLDRLSGLSLSFFRATFALTFCSVRKRTMSDRAIVLPPFFFAPPQTEEGGFHQKGTFPFCGRLRGERGRHVFGALGLPFGQPSRREAICLRS